MTDLINAMQSQTTPIVQIWMKWMVMIFLAAFLFVKNHPQAQRAILAIIGTAFGGYIIWTMTGNVHLLGIIHLLIWFPLGIYLWATVLSPKARRHDGESDKSQYFTLQYKAFFFWSCLLFITIAISLIFDVRDILLVMTGKK